MSVFQALYAAIQTRPRPEDVARLILDVLDLKSSERAILNEATRFSGRDTSMSKDFARVVGADRMVAIATKVFNIPAADPSEVMQQIATSIHLDLEHTDFCKDRLDEIKRRELGLHKRDYNRRFRAVRRFQRKIEKMAHGNKIYEATRLSKSLGAAYLPLEELEKDLPTACFVAYLSARMSLRSAFTCGSQVRAFDNIANMLYTKARKSKTVNWYAIAMVHSTKEVIDRLTEEEKGKVLSFCMRMLQEISELLEETSLKTSIDFESMVVRRGNDSSTWNTLAGAWNKVRDVWFKLIYDLGMNELLEVYCPGKVMRLMAADVVVWHGKLHADVAIWNELPKPWEVFQQHAVCSLEFVRQVCERHGVNSVGWVSPHLTKKAVQYTPTPELVHGVTVTCPYLATLIKKANWFSGKSIKPSDIEANIERDAFGAVILVSPFV